MYLDSPFERCPLCGEYVLLDQARAECAREHCCGPIECPLERFFCGRECREDDDEARTEPRVP